MGWLAGWSHRIALTIDGTVPGLAGSLSARDVAVAIPAALKAVCQANGEDLRITQSDGETTCAYGIEDWTAAEPVVHFAANSIGTGDTVFYAYGGNAGAGDAQDKANVTDANCAGFWPLGDAASPAVDWKNGYNATQSGGVTFGATGKIGTCCSFDGGDLLSTGTALSAFMSANTGTVEMWLKPTGAPSDKGWVYLLPNSVSDVNLYTGIMRGKYGGGADSLWAYGWDSTERRVQMTVALDAWQHVGWVHHHPTLYGYRNGVEEGNTGCTTIGSIGAAVRFGKSFVGAIDHIVMSSVARSADWLKFSASSFPGSGMFSWGSLESAMFATVLMGRRLGADLFNGLIRSTQ